MINWRRFLFFDKDIVKEDGNNNTTALSKIVITCSTSGRGSIILGDADGYLNIVDRDFKTTSFQAYEYAVTHVHQMKDKNMVVSIGHDEETLSSTVKIWNLDKVDKDEKPMLLRAFKVEKYTVPVTCLAVLEDFSQMAIGLCNGVVVLIKGDVLRDKVPKQKFVKGESTPVVPITGMGFRIQGKSIILFVATPSSVLSYYTSSRDQENMLDDSIGCELGCAVMSDEQDFIVGKSEAVYFYGPEGKGPCFIFEGTKQKLAWFRNYIIVVGIDTSAGPIPGQANSKTNTLNIYDLKNKFIAFTDTRFENVSQVVCEWGSIFVFTAEGKIYQLEEKDTQTKLEILFKKKLYSVAISLAHSQHYDYNSIIDIFRKYGDHLYDKGDYDGAIAQYLKTIGRLEPSYVIRKFLDAQRIHNLTNYLQALHENKLANADHTTLLLNCYTKLKDVKKLDQFIKTDLTFEVETAIKVLRQAGYYEHALYLAETHSEHDWYLKILLEDAQDYQKAIDYIGTLSFFEAEKNLKKYGKNLVSSLPEQTTKRLMKLCTSSHSVAPVPATVGSYNNNNNNNNNNYNNNEMPLSTSPPSGSHDPERDELFRNDRDQLLGGPRKLKQISPAEIDMPYADSSIKAVPEEFIHIFVNQPEWLTTFLEFIIAQGDASSLIYNTLLELYLREDGSEREDRRKRMDKAMDLLTNPSSQYDDDHALVLAQVHNFKLGVLYLYEKLKLYNEIIQYHMEHNEYDSITRACKRFGDKDPNLWVQALSYFASKEEDCHKEIGEVLQNIDRDNLIPPLLVIQILGQKPTTTLSVIKDYITKRLQAENQAITDDLRAIRNFSEETEKMRNEIQDLRTSAKIFQQSKCTVCQSALDLPAVHFLCNHSFHQRCLGENERECPVCQPTNRKILEIKRTLAENAGQHDQFFKQLDNASDGFSVVSEYFGRGIFNAPVNDEPQLVVRAAPTGKASRDMLMEGGGSQRNFYY